MGTNGIDLAADHGQAAASLDRAPLRKRTLDNWAPPEAADDFALAPLVDKIAYGIARGLIVAVKELEQHIASETRKVGDAVDRRLDTLQISMQDLTRFVGEQRSTNLAVQEQVQELKASASDASQRIDTAVAAQREADARQTAEVAALSKAMSERIDTLCQELGIHQEDIAAIKATMTTFSARVDSLVERLDRQADAVRSMCSAYSQRETELEQLVDGLARLRAYPTPLPAAGL